jgi:hypothetical protein
MSSEASATEFSRAAARRLSPAPPLDDLDEPSEFTRAADALRQPRPPQRRTAAPQRPIEREKPVLRERWPQPPVRPAEPRHRALLPKPRRGRSTGPIVILGLLAAALAAWLTLYLIEHGPTSVAPAPRDVADEPADYTLKPTPAIDALGGALPIWVHSGQSALLLANAAPALTDLDVTYEAWQHGLGGRRDIAAFGHFDVGPYVFFGFYWPGEEAEIAPSFFVDMVRQAGEAGISVIKTDVPFARSTKYGLTEMAQGVLTDGSGQRNCLVFRHRSADPNVKFSGWACGTPEQPLDPEALVCAIDQTRFLARDDEALAELLASVDKKPTTCSAPQSTTRSRALNGRS